MRALLLPLAIAANAIPIIAFAPLFNTWFGLLNPLSKMMMAAVLSFFPVMANVTRGLSGVDPGQLELMRSYAATQSTVLRKVRIPNALPYFFTALKLASTLSLIGAIVAEFVASDNGLGHLLVEARGNLDTVSVFAAIIWLIAIGFLFYFAVEIAETLFLKRRTQRRSRELGAGL